MPEVGEFPFQHREVKMFGKLWKFRELSVAENDQCADGSKNPDGTLNGRTMTRLMVMASSVDPKITPEMLGKLPQRYYLRIMDLVSELNNEVAEEEEEPLPSEQEGTEGTSKAA